MLDFEKVFRKARASGFYLWLLNILLSRMVPFNRPHKFKVIQITDSCIGTFVPYRKVNFNHIKGIHACALATLSEFTTGLALLNKVGFRDYRLIMQKMEMEYHYQAKENVKAQFEISDDWLRENVILPLDKKEAVIIVCTIKTFDQHQNHIATGKISWQIKPWDKVRTRISE